jgi:spore coat protein U-like protein
MGNVKRLVAAGVCALAFCAVQNGTAEAIHSLPSRPLRLSTTVTSNCVTLITPTFSFTLGISDIQTPNRTFELNSTISVSCTKGANVAIGMDGGLYSTHASGSQFGHRAMRLSSSSTYLIYDLCHDPACTQLWAGSGYTYISQNDTSASSPVYARIISGQHSVSLGNYSDSVTTTVNF